MAQALSPPASLTPAMALALPLLLILLGATPGLGAPGGGCGVPPSAWCQSWVTALRCGALGRCPHLTQRPLDVDACALCQQLFNFLHHASNQSAAQVEAVAEQVPGSLYLSLPVLVTPCQAVVQVLVEHLLKELQQLKPWQVCAQLKLCHGEPGGALAMPILEVPGAPLQAAAPALGSGGQGLPALPLPLCWLCRTLVARAEAAVPVGSVAEAVAGLCRALPLPVAGACQCLAERYAALALEGLLGRLGPRLLCRLFLACRTGDNWDAEDMGTLPPPRVLEAIVVRLAECVSEEDPKGVSLPALSLPLGPCALGPVFWCSGPEAARRCQALQHCQEHVWL